MIRLSFFFFHVIMMCVSAFRMPSSPLGNQRHQHHTAAGVSPIKTASTFNARSSSSSSCMSMSSSSSNNMPSQDEIAQQKSEAYNALASFHETAYSLTKSSSSQVKSLLRDLDTTSAGMLDGDGLVEEANKAEYWKCDEGAVTYGVPMDPAAGMKKGVISKPYKSSVQVEMDLGGLTGGPKRRGLRLVESIQFDNEGGGSDDNDGDAFSSLPFVRSIPLGANVDVDSVDGSYSLDDTQATSTAEAGSPSLPLLPPSLLAGMDPSAVQFLVEHTLAVSETERCRCFLLYGNVSGKASIVEEGEDDEEKLSEGERNYRLLGVVLAEETKVMPEEPKDSPSEDDGEADYASDFISQMIESSPSNSPSSPLDLLALNQSDDDTSDEDDKMKRLMESLDKHNKRVMESSQAGGAGATATPTSEPNPNTKMERHALGMFGLTSGVWLGDTFVRESIPSAVQISRARQQQKGFGMKSAKPDDDGSEEDRFATWQMGVQKLALHFEWDYRSSVTQSYTYGKVMGTPTSLSSMANIKSDGVVVVNEARRTKKREERRVIWDMEGGAYIAGLVGANYFRAPRYMSFARSRSYSADALLTEFMVFYRPEKEKSAALDLNIDTDYYGSRTSRLYNANDGSLMQGSTAFFAMSQPSMESEQ